MTGDEFIELMEVKQKEKDEEEAAKKRRKIEREEKKIIKQAMKEEKAKVRELKRLLTAEKRGKEATIRMEKKKAEKIMKKRAFRPPFKQLESCVQCGAVENNECDEQWVACDNCERWWHVHCTDTPTMSAQEFNLIMCGTVLTGGYTNKIISPL